MCDLCAKHGDGKKWYLNAKNYSDALLAEKHDAITHYLGNSHGDFLKGHLWIDSLNALPFIGKLILNSRYFQHLLQKGVFGQVVPIEDVREIFGFVKSVCRFPCVCRQMSHHKKEELFCFGVSLGFFEEKYLSRYPDVSHSFEKVTKERALEIITDIEEQGSFHSVWTMSTPFIATICNCNGRDCLSVKQRLTMGIKSFFKSEYVAKIDSKLCIGCRECRKQCNFGAIQYSSSLRNCQIHPMICYGCGICRTACPKKAIKLIERQTVPGLRNFW